MSSQYFGTYDECNTIIQFPKKPIICINKNTSTNCSLIQYDVYQVADMFDPNISGSPPNIFVNKLKQRMDEYYANDSAIRLNTKLNDIARNRTLSLSCDNK